MTTRRTLAGIVAAPVGFAVVIGIAYGAGVLNQDSPPKWAEPTDFGPTRVERLIERHDCWTETAPVGVIPGHAVVTLPGKRARLMSAEIGFNIWLGPDGQAGSGDELAGRLHAFCV